MRSLGRFLNRALLDLGWAWPAPPGTVNDKVEIGDERTVGPPPESSIGGHSALNDSNLYQRYYLGAFEREKVDSKEEVRFKKAIAIWSLLIDRDPDDAAVRGGANVRGIRFIEPCING